jgi:hypothetical protein
MGRPVLSSDFAQESLRVLEILYIKTRKKMENVRVEIPHPLVIRWLVTLHS